ncbi:MAG TPA: hypothetical protein VMH35_14820 [Streptosporangiaceae bacterium]|nr:hypothetical protein [Streptosporangiaceae bacterium]
MTEKPPLRYPAACWALARCVLCTARLLATRRLHLPTRRVGLRLRFADGTSARVYRETVADYGPVREPCLLVVGFRLRGVRGWGHPLFRWESLLNTPLFAGFPGFVSKLWLAHDQHGRYRGVYQWDGAGRADNYARALWRVLALVSVPGSIHHVVLPGLHRDEMLARAERPASPGPASPGLADPAAWWRLTGAA